MRVEHEQWRNFIRDSGLSGETDCNPAQLNKRDLVFINLGNKNIQPKELYFTPQQQYKKAPPKPEFLLYIQQRQLRLTLDRLSKSFNHLDVLPHHRDLAFVVLNRNTPTAFEEEEEERGEEEDSEDDDRNENRKASDGQSKEGVDKDKSFDFGFTSTPINLSQHPLLSKLVGEKDEIESGTVNALIWELFSLPSVKDRKHEFKFSNNTQGCLINVSTHTRKMDYWQLPDEKAKSGSRPLFDKCRRMQRMVRNGSAPT
jgi:hypothetical protein